MTLGNIKPLLFAQIMLNLYIMDYIRWYDKDPDLSHFMTFMQGLNDELRDEIAQDLIQILMGEISADSDGEISVLGESKLTNYKRWYDKDITLHSAVEIIKNLDQSKRKEILENLRESIVQILTDYNYDRK